MQNLEALWSLIFTAGPIKVNAGVVALETGRVFGGDSGYYYSGSYAARNGKLTTRVTISHYAGALESPLLGDRQHGTLDLMEAAQGQDAVGHRTITFVGKLIEDPSREVVADLTWRAALPG